MLNETKSQKRRREGGGRKMDVCWDKISAHIEEAFQKYRQVYNLQVTTKHFLIWAQETCIANEIDLKKLGEETGIRDIKKALMTRIYRFMKKKKITKRKINRANHIDEKEIGLRCAKYIRHHWRLRDGLHIDDQSLECIDEVRVFESHLSEHSQTLEFVGARDVPVRKMANPKAAHSLIIYTKSCGSELIACLVTKRAIPRDFVKEELKAGDEKFEIGLIAGLPIVKVPPGRKSWAAADVFNIFISKFLFKVPPFSVLTQIDLARGHCDTKVLTRISVTGRKVHLTPPECSGHVQSNDQLINSTFQKTVSEELSTWTLNKLMELYDQGRPSGNELHKSLLRNNLGKNGKFKATLLLEVSFNQIIINLNYEKKEQYISKNNLLNNIKYINSVFTNTKVCLKISCTKTSFTFNADHWNFQPNLYLHI